MNAKLIRKAKRTPAKRKPPSRKYSKAKAGKFSLPAHLRKGSALTDAQVMAAALADPDAQPIKPGDEKRLKRVAQAKVIRQALGMSQEQFATTFGIPLGTLRDWEQGRAEPDQAARSYLKVIARKPGIVQAILEPA
jgi:putative transcriptional regulator